VLLAVQAPLDAKSVQCHPYHVFIVTMVGGFNWWLAPTVYQRDGPILPTQPLSLTDLLSLGVTVTRLRLHSDDGATQCVKVTA